MKKRYFLPILLVLLTILFVIGGPFLYQKLTKWNQEPVSIIIASDMHYLSPEYRGTYFKEPSGMFDGKVIHYSPEYFDAFLNEVVKKHPQVLILSGDITLNGSQKSHEEVVEKLKEVQDAGIQVLVIPGNHDVETTAGDYTDAEPVIVDNVSTDEFMELYENFGPTQALSRDEASFSYIYEVTPTLRIVMLDTNSYYHKCSVQAETLLWLEEQLKDAKAAGADVIGVSHQNLHIHSELLYFTYQLYNADELYALYEKYDVKLNLSGHIHIQSIVTDSEVPEVAVGSLGVAGTQYGELTYNGKSIEYTTAKTDVSAYAVSQGFTDENLLDFNNYSTWYFEEVGRLKSYSSFTDTNLTEEEKNLLAETFAIINSAYFMGETIDTEHLADGITLWKKQESDFTSRYIDSMLKEADVDNQTLRLLVY